jgi:hypothetical protein
MSLKKKKRYTDELIIHYIGRGREMSLKKKKAKYESYEFK